MKTINIKELLAACEKEVAKGNGDKNIYISDDEEGNGVHGLYYLFTNEKATLDIYPELEGEDDVVILG